MKMQQVLFTTVKIEKEAIPEGEPTSYFKIGDDVFELHLETIRNLGIDNQDAVVRYCHELRMDPLPYFRTNCLECGHFSLLKTSLVNIIASIPVMLAWQSAESLKRLSMKRKTRQG